MEIIDSAARKSRKSAESLPQQNTYFFLGLTINMSWQLALAVIVPVYGGYLLDNRFHSTPLYLIIGGVTAVSLAIYVVKQTLKNLNEAMNEYLKKDDSKQ